MTIRTSIRLLTHSSAFAQDNDIAILNGRVMDPETNFDGVRNVGVKDGKIVMITEDASGHVVEGNGFGCVMLRGNVLKESLFTYRQPPYDFDPAIYERLKHTGVRAKLNWNAECEHLDVVSMKN